MRVHDVRVGETYDVTVPLQLPAQRYPRRWDWMRCQLGETFPLTVTALVPGSAPPMVDGLRVVRSPYVELVLTDDQAAMLGLPPDRYLIGGSVHRDGGGQLLDFPRTYELQVPVRWLRAPARPAPAVALDLDEPLG